MEEVVVEEKSTVMWVLEVGGLTIGVLAVEIEVKQGRTWWAGMHQGAMTLKMSHRLSDSYTCACKVWFNHTVCDSKQMLHRLTRSPFSSKACVRQ